MAHEPMVDAVASTAQGMIRSKHFATSDVQTRLDELKSEMKSLKDLASERRAKLQESLEVQKVSNLFTGSAIIFSQERGIFRNFCGYLISVLRHICCGVSS